VLASISSADQIHRSIEAHLPSWIRRVDRAETEAARDVSRSGDASFESQITNLNMDHQPRGGRRLSSGRADAHFARVEGGRWSSRSSYAPSELPLPSLLLPHSLPP